MKIKPVTGIFIVLSIVCLSSQKASAIDMKPLLENLVNQLGNQLINKMLSSPQTPTNQSLPYQPLDNNYPSNPNYSNPYPSSPIPNNYPSYPSTPSSPPTQYSPAPSNPMPFIYNPVIIVPQSPPIFNNYSNNMPR